jgi:hypothetical protein
VTGLLLAWGTGDEAAFDRLVPIVCEELRRIARRCRAGQLMKDLEPPADAKRLIVVQNWFEELKRLVPLR